jgi:capsular polysaccharide biosynthesis protein
MRVESERPRAADDTDLDSEREIDLARYGWAILSRWWLVLAAAAIGAVIGWLVSVGGGDVYQARATLYPGQPLTPGSNSQIQSLQTNPTTINQIVKSESVIRSVANDVGISPDQLRDGISTRAVAGAVARAGQVQLVEVIVRGPWRRQSAEAANRLSEIAVDRLSTYPVAKIEQLRARLQGIEEQLAALDESIERYRDVLNSPEELSTTDRLVVVGLLSDAQSQRGSLVAQQTETSLSLSLAEDVERGRVITRATANRVAAQSSRSSIVIGAVIGLVVGILLALVWDPLRRRFGRSRPEQPAAP